MKIIEKRYKDWSIGFRRNLRDNLTNKTDGISSGIINYLYNFPSHNPPTFVAFIGDDPVGWAIIAKGIDVSHPSIMVYVAKDYRRKGIGKALIKYATRKTGRCVCYVWNSVSFEFYKHMSSPLLIPLDWQYEETTNPIEF